MNCMVFWGGNSFLPGRACMTSVSCQMICNTTIWLYGSSAKVGRRSLTCRARILLWTCPRFPEVLINAHPNVFHHFVYLFSLVPLMLLPQHCTSWAEHISSSSKHISLNYGDLSHFGEFVLGQRACLFEMLLNLCSVHIRVAQPIKKTHANCFKCQFTRKLSWFWLG